MIFFRYSKLLIKEREMTLFKLFQINSIGFKSGEYGGKKRPAWMP
jgi:hypothetical protein